MKNFQAGGFAAIATAVALIATSAVPAAAATRDPTTEDGAPKQERVAPKREQKYCVKDDVTGSRVPRTVCKTRADWIAEDGFDPAAKR